MSIESGSNAQFGRVNSMFAAIATAALATCLPVHASVIISNGATENIVCEAGLCKPTAKSAVLNTSELSNMLAAGDVKIASGKKAAKIVIESGFSWATTSKLTLDSFSSITIQAPIVVFGTGGLTLTTNDKGSGGVVSIGDLASITLWDLSSQLEINGTRYALVGDISTLANEIKLNPSGAFALAKNYDATRDGIFKRSPVTTPFSGKFEGLGNTIANLSIRNKKTVQNVGMFSASSGSISHIRLSNSKVFGGDGGAIGGIVGVNSGHLVEDFVQGSVGNTVEQGGGARIGEIAGVNSGVIEGASSEGTAIAGFYGYVGGLVGDNNLGVIFNSHSSANVGGGASGYPGGLVSLNSGSISNSQASGAVSPLTSQGTIAGGLVSVSKTGGTISNSYATGSVTTGEFGTAGGLAGGNAGSISDCFATGAISDGGFGGDIWGGGLVGFSTGTINNSYATGSVTAYSGYLGGLVGQSNGMINASYSVGRLSDQGYETGGFVGIDGNSGGITAAYWDTDTSGIADLSRGAGNLSNDSGILGMTTKQLRSGLPPGFAPNAWTENRKLNNGLPYLRSVPPPGEGKQ